MEGFLLKVGSSEIPNTYINKGTYKSSCDKILAGSHQDADGVDHFDVMKNRKLNVELKITDCPEDIYLSIINLIRSNFINMYEENVIVTAYVPKLGAHVVQECVFEDTSPNIYAIVNGKIIYQDITLKFNGKGGPVNLTPPGV